MAFYRCGNSKSTTLIDGVESEEEVKLKSLGKLFTQSYPEPPMGSIRYDMSSSTTVSSHNGSLFHKVKDAFYYCDGPIFYKCKDNNWTYLLSTGRFGTGYAKRLTDEFSMTDTSAFVLNDILYFIAEWVDDKTEYITKFNDEDCTFSKVVEFPYPDSYYLKAIPVSDEEVYLWYYKNPIVKYSIKDNTFTEITTAPVLSHQALDMIVYNNEIHIIGATSNGDSNYKHYKYSFEDNTWIEVSTLPTGTRCSIEYTYNVIIDNKWYRSINGYIYKYENDSWSQLNRLPNFRAFNNQGMCMCSYSSYLLAGELHEAYELIKE